METILQTCTVSAERRVNNMEWQTIISGLSYVAIGTVAGITLMLIYACKRDEEEKEE